jgi:hypothetical protein
MYSSGQKDKSVAVFKGECFYNGSILIGLGEVASLRIHNCKEIKDANVDNMVGEISVVAEEGDCKVDPVPKGIPCPVGMCAILEGSAKYHVRGSPLPY